MGAEPGEAVEEPLPVVRMIEHGERLPRKPVAQLGQPSERRLHQGIEFGRLRCLTEQGKRVSPRRDADAGRCLVAAELAISRLVPDDLVAAALLGARSGLQGFDPGPYTLEALTELAW